MSGTKVIPITKDVDVRANCLTPTLPGNSVTVIRVRAR